MPASAALLCQRAAGMDGQAGGWVGRQTGTCRNTVRVSDIIRWDAGGDDTQTMKLSVFAQLHTGQLSDPTSSHRQRTLSDSHCNRHK